MYRPSNAYKVTCKTDQGAVDRTTARRTEDTNGKLWGGGFPAYSGWGLGRDLSGV